MSCSNLLTFRQHKLTSRVAVARNQKKVHRVEEGDFLRLELMLYGCRSERDPPIVKPLGSF